ncbi:unnamed protein product, partial [Schistosoma curassoni]|uniref:Reverse transcriptase domain-containing protein n=1 Tax=Schistosoma curassoni TaxID=6186 RepID=A0A183JRZ5_9TREM
ICRRASNDNGQSPKRRKYDTTKKLEGKYSKPERLIKEGKTITEIQEQRNRWVGYFEEFLNRSASLKPPSIEAAPTDLPVDLIPQTTEEIRMTIRQIKSGKAAGPDNMPAKTLKSDTEVTARILHVLFRKIWGEEQVPTDWKEKYYIKTPKKGDLSKCENFFDTMVYLRRSSTSSRIHMTDYSAMCGAYIFGALLYQYLCV